MYGIIGGTLVFPYQKYGFESRCISFHFFKKEEFKMKRLIDWFRKPAIMSKLIHTAGMFDGDFVVYKHHRYYVNCQTGVVIRVE